MKAAELGNFQCVDMLIKGGANVNDVNSKDEAALVFAAEMQSTKLLSL